MRFLRFVLNDIGLKLASLVLAVLLWFVIAGEKTSEVGFSVPLELQNVPRDLEVVSGIPTAIEVRVRATAAIVRQLGREDLAVQLDMSGVSSGERIFHLSESIVRRPFGVSVVKLNPAIVNLSLERTQRKTVPVQVRTDGAPAEGYEVTDIACEPAEITLAGPRSRLQSVVSAYTETVMVTGVREDVVRSASVGVDEPLARLNGKTRVTVTVRVREVSKTRVFKNVPVQVKGVSAYPQPGQVQVVVAGPASRIRDLKVDAVSAFVEARRLAGRTRKRIEVEIDDKDPLVVVQSVDPEHVLLIPNRGVK